MFKKLMLLICFWLVSSCASQSSRLTKSPNFKNGVFTNSSGIRAHSFWDTMKVWWKTEITKWPEWRYIEKSPRPPLSVSERNLRVTFINHATVLIQIAGLNILTDPHYSKRASPLQWTGPKRVHAPGIAFSELPKIDIVLISHDHYDHLDLGTLHKLVERDNPQIYVGLGVKKITPGAAHVIELDWWETQLLPNNISISFAETQHFSGRSLFDRDESLWGAFVLDIDDFKIYFGGDSGYGDHYKKTTSKYGAMDLAFLPIGAYEPRDFAKTMHMNPSDAVKAHLDLNSQKSIGIHFGTFQLTAEGIDQPVFDLNEAVKKAGLSKNDFNAIKPGDSITITY